jgi:hypothetical protein
MTEDTSPLSAISKLPSGESAPPSGRGLIKRITERLGLTRPDRQEGEAHAQKVDEMCQAGLNMAREVIAESGTIFVDEPGKHYSAAIVGDFLFYRWESRIEGELFSETACLIRLHPGYSDPQQLLTHSKVTDLWLKSDDYLLLGAERGVFSLSASRRGEQFEKYYPGVSKKAIIGIDSHGLWLSQDEETPLGNKIKVVVHYCDRPDLLESLPGDELHSFSLVYRLKEKEEKTRHGRIILKRDEIEAGPISRELYGFTPKVRVQARRVGEKEERVALAIIEEGEEGAGREVVLETDFPIRIPGLTAALIEQSEAYLAAVQAEANRTRREKGETPPALLGS